MTLILEAVVANPVHAQAPTVNVTTYHYDNQRTGWNNREPQLTTANVNDRTFGLLRSLPLDDQVDAQPLIITGNIDGQRREVAYVVTESNSVYAFDVSTGAEIAHRKLGDPVPQSRLPGQCDNNGPNVGINSTPVIEPDSTNDLAKGTLYLIAFMLEANQPVYRIHALDLATLGDRVPPRIITASNTLNNGAKVDFTPAVSRQRPALVLANGNIYAGFGSFCDKQANASRGWLLGWQVGSLTPLKSNQLNDRRTETNSLRDPEAHESFFLGSIWMSGYGIATDESGNLLFITGNSDPSGPFQIDPVSNLQESVVKMDGELRNVLDYFTPSGAKFGLEKLEIFDDDFGSGGVLLIPGDQPGPTKHLAIAAGKVGQMYLLDRDNLGKYDPTGSNHVLGAFDIGGKCWCGQSYFVGADGIGRVVSSGGDNVIVWKIQNAPTASLVKEYKTENPAAVWQKGFFTSISSNGQAPGTAIIWAVRRPTTTPPELALRAYDAKTGQLLYSAAAGAWPNTGGAANTVPVVANGRVYVASNKELRIFGLGGQVVASAAMSQLASLARHRAKTLYGSVFEVEGAKFWLRTRTDLVHVDATGAKQKQSIVALVPGRAVVVHGSVDSSSGMNADSINYAPESPALWPPDQ